MILVNGFHTLFWAFGFLFSHWALVGLSLVASAGRFGQILLFPKHRAPARYAWVAALVQLSRLVQYALFLTLGTGMPLSGIGTGAFWETFFRRFATIRFPDFLWDLLGFAVVFGVYNALLFLVLHRPPVARLLQITFAKHPVPAVRTAILLGFKNLFLIPVSMAYLFRILHLI